MLVKRIIHNSQLKRFTGEKAYVFINDIKISVTIFEIWNAKSDKIINFNTIASKKKKMFSILNYNLHNKQWRVKIKIETNWGGARKIRK